DLADVKTFDPGGEDGGGAGVEIADDDAREALGGGGVGDAGEVAAVVELVVGAAMEPGDDQCSLFGAAVESPQAADGEAGLLVDEVLEDVAVVVSRPRGIGAGAAIPDLDGAARGVPERQGEPGFGELEAELGQH